jgi:hypothetical protein
MGDRPELDRGAADLTASQDRRAMDSEAEKAEE